jgi:hypothetical protein
MSVLSLSDKIDKFKPSAYSYSFKFKQNTAVIISDSQTLVGYGVNGGDPAVIQDGLTIYTNNNELNIEYRIGGTSLIELETPYTPNAFNHVVVVNDSTGHFLYIDGVLVTTATYTVGSSAVNMNVSSFTDLAIGGEVGELDGRPNVSVDEYQHPFNGWLSDFSFWNRNLNATEAVQLYEDNYGYCVYILAG